MLSQSQIAEWRKQYSKLYYIAFSAYNDSIYIFVIRPLTLEDVIKFPSLGQFEEEDYLIKKCVIFPNDVFHIIDKYPGVATSLTTHIKNVSGLNEDVGSLADEYGEAVANNGMLQMLSVIMGEYSAYKFEDLQIKTIYDIAELYSMASWLTKIKYRLESDSMQSSGGNHGGGLINADGEINDDIAHRMLMEKEGRLDPTLSDEQRELRKQKEHDEVLERYNKLYKDIPKRKKKDPLEATPGEFIPTPSILGAEEKPHFLEMTEDERRSFVESKRLKIEGI